MFSKKKKIETRASVLREDLLAGGLAPMVLFELYRFFWPEEGRTFVTGLVENQSSLAGNALTLAGLFLASLTVLMVYLASDRMKKYAGHSGLDQLISVFTDAIKFSTIFGIIMMLLAISRSIFWAPISMGFLGFIVLRLFRCSNLLREIMVAHTKPQETVGMMLQAEIEREKPLVSHM